MVWIFIKRQTKTGHCDSMNQKVNSGTTQFYVVKETVLVLQMDIHTICHNIKILFVPIQKENDTVTATCFHFLLPETCK